MSTSPSAKNVCNREKLDQGDLCKPDYQVLQAAPHTRQLGDTQCVCGVCEDPLPLSLRDRSRWQAALRSIIVASAVAVRIRQACTEPSSARRLLLTGSGLGQQEHLSLSGGMATVAGCASASCWSTTATQPDRLTSHTLTCSDIKYPRDCAQICNGQGTSHPAGEMLSTIYHQYVLTCKAI